MTLGAARLYVVPGSARSRRRSPPTGAAITMKALTAVDETPDDRKARRLVFARMQIAELTLTINALTAQRASFVKKEAKCMMKPDHPALVACEARRDAELGVTS